MVDGPSKMLQFWFLGALSALNWGIPADARLLEGDPLKISQSALTGESLPVTKNPSDEVFSGSTCKQGEIEAVVIATGVHTFFGKATHLVDSTNQVGHFQKVLTTIGNLCICSIAVGIAIEIIVMYPIQHRKYRDGIDNLLVLLIGGIPIAMPTVLSVTRGLLLPTLTLMATGIEQAKVRLSRGIPERVFPLSKGVCQNIYNFCFGQTNLYSLERLPTALEIEEKSRPYTCLDFLTCHCC